MAKRPSARADSPGLWYRLCQGVVLSVAAAAGLIWWLWSDGPETHAALALLQYLPFVVYLLPAAVAVLASGWLSWWWRGLALASLTVVLTALMGLCWGHSDEGYGRIRVMSYNVKAYLALGTPGGTTRLALEIMQHDPDVILMQDAGEIMSLQRSPEVFKSIMGGREVKAFGQYIIASRLPLKDCAPGLLPYRNQNHTFYHCVMTAHGKEIDLVTVHFTTPRDGLNATRQEGLKGLDAWRGNVNDRLTQSGHLAEQLRLMTRPRIVAGDLNAPEGSTVVQALLHTGLRDAFSSAGVGYGYTHGHSLWPGVSFLRIDHILVDNKIGVSQAFVGGSLGSQHRPVIADLLLMRQ
jgi:endonuclease/exonuclease/phosphatase (EEP) superfamily protein YafD